MNTDPRPSTDTFARQYRTYRGLPPLAGLGSFPDAVKPGLSVEESVRRLKVHHYALKRLHQIFLARLTAEPIYELKMAFSYHGWLCAEHVAALRARVGEMREPPLGLDRVPAAGLQLLFDEIRSAPTTETLLLGLYEVALPQVLAALERHRTVTHILADQPTRRLLKTCQGELEEMVDYGQKAISSLVEPSHREAFAPARARLNQCLAAMGGFDGTDSPTGTLPQPEWSAQPAVFDGIPQRDSRFPDPYNMGVNAEVFLYDNAQPLDAKVLMMFYKRIREIDVPEMMSSIITQTPDKPWGYYRDLTRQLWDEARHAMMGEVGFASVGVDWPEKVMVNFTWSLGLNSQLTPKERHAVLYFIEQGLMPKTGKRHEWEVGVMSKNPLAATFQDFDWADEVLHARVGRDWYVSDMPSAHEAVAYGDRCWSKVLMGWNAWRAEGLTEHRNWWPGLYTQYCERNQLTPNQEVLSYATSYESVRADLKDISASA
ncbi:MAG TPA: hypothetical protein VMF06_10425 [Candidatus Limnocylindria bacterium]|nr:hypothetical protein [Candidatus Limnocylindria bacterium]